MTGVQTCALPIFLGEALLVSLLGNLYKKLFKIDNDLNYAVTITYKLHARIRAQTNLSAT